MNIALGEVLGGKYVYLYVLASQNILPPNLIDKLFFTMLLNVGTKYTNENMLIIL